MPGHASKTERDGVGLALDFDFAIFVDPVILAIS